MQRRQRVDRERIEHALIDAARQQRVHDLKIAACRGGNQYGASVAVLRVRIYSGVEERIDRHHVARLRGGEEPLLVKVVTTQLQYLLRRFRSRLPAGIQATSQHQNANDDY